MKKMMMATLAFLMTTVAILNAQEVVGDWSGELDVQGMKLPLILHITKKDNVYSTTMDSPMQGAKDIPTGTTTIIEDSLHISIPSIGAKYAGKLKEGQLKGVFNQQGLSFPLILSKGAETKTINRPQEPKAPFPYDIEEVTFKNPMANNITFGGTLTLPKNVKNPPVAIMITGSGSQNRNEELLGHKPFLVIADYLTRNGIAVLRYDDRGNSASEAYIPEGFKDNTTLDFALDAEAALDYLKTRADVVNIKKIGYIGHSEGGLIAPIVASKRHDVAFCVLLAGPGVDGEEVLLTQARKSGELSGRATNFLDINEEYSRKLYALVKEKPEQLSDKMKVVFNELIEAYPALETDLPEKVINAQIKSLSSDWMRTFLMIDPTQYLSKVTCPILALNGEKDFQVLPELNLSAIEKTLKKANNKDFTVKELPNLNHLFQTAETGAFEEYAKIEETFSPVASELIGNWLKARM